MFNRVTIILGNPSVSISTVIQGFKSFVYKEIKDLVSTQNNSGDREVSSTEKIRYLVKKYKSIWQKSFYDHIIRDERDLQKIRQYICDNSLRWELDLLNLANDKNTGRGWAGARKVRQSRKTK